MKKCRVILSVGETLSIVYTSTLRNNVKIIDYTEYNCIDFINNGMIKDEYQVVSIIKEELNSHKKEYQVEGVSVLLPSSFYTEEYVTVENNKKMPLQMYFSKTYFKSDAVNPKTEIVDWVKVGDKKVTTQKGINKATICLVSKLDSKKSFTFLNLLITEKIPVDHVMSPGLGVSNIATLTSSYEDAGRLVVFTGDTKTILVVTQSGFPIIYKEFKKGLVDLKEEICDVCKISYEEAAYLLKVLGVNEDLNILDYLQSEREKSQLHNRYAIKMTDSEESSKDSGDEKKQTVEGLVFANEEVDVDDIDKIKEMQLKSDEESEEEEMFYQKGFSLEGFKGEETQEKVSVVETSNEPSTESGEDVSEVKEEFKPEEFDLADGDFVSGEADFEEESFGTEPFEEAPALHLRAQESTENVEEFEDFEEDNDGVLQDLSRLLEDEVAGMSGDSDAEVDFDITGIADEARNIKRMRNQSAKTKSASNKQKKARQSKRVAEEDAAKEKKPLFPFLEMRNHGSKSAEQASLLFEEIKAKTDKSPNPALDRLANRGIEDDLEKLLKTCKVDIESLKTVLKAFFKSYFEPIDLLVNTCSEKDGILIDTVSVISTDIKDIDLMVADYLSLNLLKIDFAKDKAVSKDRIMVMNTCEEFRAKGVINIGGSLSFLQKKGGL